MFENRIPPPFVVVFIGAVMWLTARWSAPVSGESSWRWPLALTIGGLGLAVLLLGVSAFARAKTTIDPVNIDRASTVVTTGIFNVTRNPMYVGFTLILLAWACFLAVPAVFVGPVLFVWVIDRLQIVPEERAMLSKFGEPYRTYQLKVRRWL